MWPVPNACSGYARVHILLRSIAFLMTLPAPEKLSMIFLWEDAAGKPVARSMRALSNSGCSARARARFDVAVHPGAPLSESAGCERENVSEPLGSTISE